MFFSKIKKLFSKHKFPDFLIIGAQKAGTTSLYYYLTQSNQISVPLAKEVGFFHKLSNYEKGFNSYLKNFPVPFWEIPNTKLTFEATPDYLYYTDSFNRIKEHNKEIKLIILLREPVSRAYSAWNMYKLFTPEQIKFYFFKPNELNNPNPLRDRLYKQEQFPSFKELVDEEVESILSNSTYPIEPSFVRRGIYVEQIKQLFKSFPKEQLLILGFKDLTNNLQPTIKKVCNFIQISEFDVQEISEVGMNKRNYSEKMDAETKTKLKEFYLPYNKQLFELIGFQPDW